MSVTLYRCSKCRGLFPTVFESVGIQLCRNCKMGGSPLDPIGGSPERQSETGADIKIVEPAGDPIVVNPAGGGAQFFAENENPKIAQLNRLTERVFESNPSLGQYVFEVPKDSKYEFKFSGFKEPGAEVYTAQPGPISGKIMPGGKIALDRPIIRRNVDGTTDVVDIIDQDVLFPTQVSVVKGFDSPPEPQPDPHAAMLNPKRKMRL